MKISTSLINRKKIIVFAIAMAIGTASIAQVRIGVQARGNLSSANATVGDFPDFKKTARVLPGAGILVDIPVSKNFSIHTGANYQKNGVILKYELPADAGETIDLKLISNLNYVQVPVNFIYTTAPRSVQFFAGAGPYAGFGISGKNKIKMTSSHGDVIMEDESDAFKKEEDGGSGMKRLDIGAQAVAGVKLGKYFASVSYQAGFSNLTDNAETNDKYKNRGVQLTLGYYIR